MTTLMFAALCLIGMASGQVAVTSVTLNAATRKVFLDGHNEQRNMYGIPALTWDTKLENYARDQAAKCSWAHSDGPYGENIATSSPKSTNYAQIATDHVKLWVDEGSILAKRDVDWSCKAGGFNAYMQMLSSRTQRLGCAIAHCPALPNYTVCIYDPPCMTHDVDNPDFGSSEKH